MHTHPLLPLRILVLGWRDRTVIPSAWLLQAVCVNPDLLRHAPPAKWQYGFGFWANQQAQIWLSLPHDTFAASGAGSQHIRVCPSLDLVFTQSPGIWNKQEENDPSLLRKIVDACHS
ncbi:MAG: hypothetical protein WDZ49_03260 [Litorilinea sp.]